MKKSFFFEGEIPASKSLLNRALICQSYEPSLKIKGHNTCLDVQKLTLALKQLKTNQKKAFDCGQAGTTFRFLALRLSRIKGEHILTGTHRLIHERPQKELLEILRQLHVHVQVENCRWIIRSQGWPQDYLKLHVSTQKSSQFLSALVLNAWELPTPLEITWDPLFVSKSYFFMTLKLLKKLGLHFQIKKRSLFIPPHQKIFTHQVYYVEPDMSSLFVIATFAALSGKAIFHNFPYKSLQPDKRFLNFFQSMQIKTKRLPAKKLLISYSPQREPLEASLYNSPDLFPVLAFLCALTPGKSHLKNIPQLVYKESNRLKKVTELLSLIKVPYELENDSSIRIYGRSFEDIKRRISPFTFSSDQDHRLAFAAGLLQYLGIPLSLEDPEVVQKSFPEFWNMLSLEFSSKTYNRRNSREGYGLLS
ncbi:MAG: 3-phosphoshikimate 1-carboxyvinyltransferase [Bdellovibrio sp.]|nr:MAG: 3-phosphoshikimate 1-carboxyvinyltransferase [Bdellovibrio sp.]